MDHNSILEERIDAVQEILESYDELLLTLRNLIKGLPDLAKGLSRIQYGQVRYMQVFDILKLTINLSSARLKNCLFSFLHSEKLHWHTIHWSLKVLG